MSTDRTSDWSLKACRERADKYAYGKARHSRYVMAVDVVQLLALVDRTRPYLRHHPECDAVNEHLDKRKRVCDCGRNDLLALLDGKEAGR